jgi:hypothetical protein
LVRFNAAGSFQADPTTHSLKEKKMDSEKATLWTLPEFKRANRQRRITAKEEARKQTERERMWWAMENIAQINRAVLARIERTKNSRTGEIE